MNVIRSNFETKAGYEATDLDSFHANLNDGLETNGSGRILNYHLRMRDHKREAVRAFKSLNYTVYAAGDSYNDTNMLTEADAGFLFKAPDKVIQEFPQFPVTRTYSELKAKLFSARAKVAPM